MMYYSVVVGCSSSDVTSGALQVYKGQHRFSLLLCRCCSSGCNSGLGWASSLLWCLLILLWLMPLT